MLAAAAVELATMVRVVLVATGRGHDDGDGGLQSCDRGYEICGKEVQVNAAFSSRRTSPRGVTGLC